MSSQLIPLSYEEAAEIYQTKLIHHFPPEEVKPLFKIKDMWELGGYEVLGYYQDEALMAYAFLTLCPDSKVVLLDYYAVLDEYRGSGIGSRILKALKNKYNQEEKTAIIIETEDLDHARTEEEVEERIRRDRFYTRNGVVKTSITSRVYDAFYRVWYLSTGGSLTEAFCRQEYDKIYRFMLSEDGYRKQFELNH